MKNEKKTPWAFQNIEYKKFGVFCCNILLSSKLLFLKCDIYTNTIYAKYNQVLIGPSSNFNFVYFRAMSKDRGLFRTTGSFAAIVPDVRIRQNSPLSHPPWNVSNVQRDLSCLTQPCSTIQTTNWMGKALMKTDNIVYTYMYIVQTSLME